MANLTLYDIHSRAQYILGTTIFYSSKQTEKGSTVKPLFLFALLTGKLNEAYRIEASTTYPPPAHHHDCVKN